MTNIAIKTALIIGKLLKTMGREIIIEKNGVTKKFYAYLNPIREKNISIFPSELGQLDNTMYLLLCPISTETENLDVGDILLCSGCKYWTRTIRKIYFADDAAYLWGITSLVQEEILGN